MDALAVAEFLACFGALCEAPPLPLAEVQRAAARPLGGGGALAGLYTALLRCVLLEKVRVFAMRSVVLCTGCVLLEEVCTRPPCSRISGWFCIAGWPMTPEFYGAQCPLLSQWLLLGWLAPLYLAINGCQSS